MTNPDQTYKELLREAKADKNIIGFFLGGSRGKGYGDKFSDYDAVLVVADKAAGAYKKKIWSRDLSGFDLNIYSLSEFRKYAAWQGEMHWDRYDFTHVKALVDKTGEVQKLIDEKGTIPADKRQEFIHCQIDAYINGFFRSVKAHQKLDAASIKLEAAGSVFHLLHALFALEGRMAPFAGYLVRELRRHPLKKFPMSSTQLLRTLLKIVETGDIKTQQNLARLVERVYRGAGFNKVFDDWEVKLPWALKFRK